MKKTFILFTFPLSLFTFAQIGINTSSPKSTFDISIKRNELGIADNNQTYGLLPPRISRADLTDNAGNYNADQKGAIIYITDISGGNTNVPRTNINAVGHYYFDGTLWQKIMVSTTASNGLSITNNNVKLGGPLQKLLQFLE